MVVENANIKDVTLLTELRLEYLKEDHGKFLSLTVYRR